MTNRRIGVNYSEHRVNNSEVEAFYSEHVVINLDFEAFSSDDEVINSEGKAFNSDDGVFSSDGKANYIIIELKSNDPPIGKNARQSDYLNQKNKECN